MVHFMNFKRVRIWFIANLDGEKNSAGWSGSEVKTPARLIWRIISERGGGGR
jgi:hypothetical protein